MKHFIGTRFNLKTETWISTKSGNTVLTEEWLLQRLGIFEKYCLPSVINQTNLEFHWCLFFDIKTPPIFREKIESITKRFPYIHSIFIDKMEDLVSAFKAFIHENSEGNTHVITTRIDNDDIIHRDFVKTIQSLFRPNDLCVIDLRRGYQLSIDVEPAEVRNYSHPFNAFLSIIEPVNSCSTIYSRQHYHWKNEKTIVYEKKRLWIELSHDENYVNHRQVKLKMSYSFEPKRFALSEQFQIDVFNAFIENSRIDFMNMQLFILDLFRKIKKIPFRARRWVLKKFKKYSRIE